jgi:2,4-dienoyl-CoA reductase-like NADH-dependent reductase (Old Yellow Enzyme family)
VTHALFDPITLRGLEVRNRIWIPPMCQYSVEARDGVPTDWHLVHLGGLARGGAGAVVVEATGVVPEGRITPHDLGLWNDEQRDAFSRITDFLHSQGAAAGIQLAHAGRKASTSRGWGPDRVDGTLTAEQGGWQTVAPSPVAFPGMAVPTELTVEGIADVVRAFAEAARRAVDAGFDIIELHGAHGYLLHEFLSPLSNQRTDQYGGSLEDRARALLETVDAVRAEIGEDVPLVVRLSATDWVEGGWDLPQSEQLSVWLREHGVDLVSVSTGGNVADAPIPVGPGYQLPFATAIRQAADVPVAAVGMIDDPFQAEQIVALGQADVVLIGRGALRDPNFPVRAAAALRQDASFVPDQYARAHN